jgi:nitrite reductase/ring-hydroxylating ferredoxin subunit
MDDVLVGEVAEFDGGKRKVITRAGKEVVVLKAKGRFFAFENTCLHMGGPVGEGLILGKVEAVLDENQCLVRERFSDEELHLICPWHGFEYDLETGEFAGDRRKRLRSYEVVEQGGNVYVRA